MESNHNKDFDKQVRQKFEDFSAEVSPSLWAAIEKEITPEEDRVGKVFNLKRYRYIGVAAASLIIGFTIWQIQPEERVFLRGQGTVEETAFVKEPEFKQLVDDKITPLIVEKEKEPVSASMPKPATVTIVNDVDEDQRSEDISLREPLLAVNIPVENESESLINEVSAVSSLNKTLDVKDEHLASLDQGIEVMETEPEERSGIVSGILNFVAANIQIGEGKRVEFTENEHGIIKIGLKR